MGEKMKQVGIYGVPRSGTSWIGEIFNSSPHVHFRYQPLFSYAHKNFLGVHSSREDVDEFFDRLLRCEDDFTVQREKRGKGLLPVFEKGAITHVIHKEGQSSNILFNLIRKTVDLKVIAVIRSPLSVINSWLQAPSEFRGDLGWLAIKEWRYAAKKNLNCPELCHGYEKWKEAVGIYRYLQGECPDRFRIVQYSELLADSVQQTEKMFSFCGLECADQTLSFLTASSTTQDDSPYSVFRSNQSDEKWKDQLPAQIADEITKDLRGTALGEYL